MGGKGTRGDPQGLAHICNIMTLISELQRGGESGEEVDHQMEAKASRVSLHRAVMTNNDYMVYVSKYLEGLKIILPQTRQVTENINAFNLILTLRNVHTQHTHTYHMLHVTPDVCSAFLSLCTS